MIINVNLRKKLTSVKHNIYQTNATGYDQRLQVTFQKK